MIKPFDLKNKSNEYKNVDEGIINEVYLAGARSLL
jgi:hypothetical protein